ncbi:MAG: ATP-dependent RNA helicase HrpA [Phycisphaerales bacterium]|nr:ATP-dependent RNA helicase HrpA [Phycisphaerales bacterium]
MADPSDRLPVLQRREEIRGVIERHQVVVLCGATGSGKTTQLPQICLDMGLPGLIAHTQPRRLAARAVAARIAEERGEPLGGVVGVKVRFHDQTSRRTRIKVLTDGMLLAELAAEPDLASYGTIIIDEAHERSLNIDFLLGYVRGLLDRRRDLKLIVTSATIDPGRFSRHFGGPSRAPIIEVSGRLFPVEVRYRPSEEGDGGGAGAELIADAVEDLPGGRGDVLVFLPGEREIRQAADALRRRGGGVEILPLFSRLSEQEQDRIFHPSGGRRVVLATNIAETSLTVPGIRYVVDTGLARLGRYDPERKIQGLPIEEISRASADQRAGRCGRIEAGVCVRLYSETSYRARPAFTEPEIKRTSLASVVLRMKALGLGRVEDFPLLDPPEAAAIRDGHETLFELGAVGSTDHDAPLTDIGRRMFAIPVDPRIARMLLAAEQAGALEHITVLAAALSIQDPRERPGGRQDEADRAQAVFRNERSDFLTLLQLWDQYRHAEESMTRGGLTGWCRDHFLSPSRMREWGEMIAQLARVCAEQGIRGGAASATEDSIHSALLTGLISNVACREGEAGSFEYRGVRGNRLQIFPGSVLFKRAPKWIMAAELVQTSKLFARTVAKIEPEWIEALAGHMFRHQVSDAHFDADAGEPSGWERVTMSGIVVVPRRRVLLARIDPAASREILIRDGLVRGRWNADLGFVARNRATMEDARGVEARLRRRDVLVPESGLEAWFDRRIPSGIADGASLSAWYREGERKGIDSLNLSLSDVVRGESRRALDPLQFPAAICIAARPGAAEAALVYRWAPGQEDDGLTVTVRLEQLPEIEADRLDWLIPGWLEDLLVALFKTLPKSVRAQVEAGSDLSATARSCAGVMSFGVGPLRGALSEALQVLLDVRVRPEEWAFKSLPTHLRMRVRVVDEVGRELGADRDVSALLTRFAGRLRRSQATRERAGFERRNLVEWSFGPLVERIETESGVRFPVLLDEGDSVTFTFVGEAGEAGALNYRGVRRLLALACGDEIAYYLEAMSSWPEMVRRFSQLGDEAGLRADLAGLIADRTFLEGQSLPRCDEEFQARLAGQRGRLATGAREVGEAAARVLEARQSLAQRLSGGTPRLWAGSVADIREHAAFLMPRGFLRALAWDRVRHYPRYVETMRTRLFALREEGMRAERSALERVGPHWKRFTAWVANRMSAERERSISAGDGVEKKTSGKAPLPQARRAAPVVNVDAGEWAIRPGRMPAAVEGYRWALEEYRAILFGAGPAKSCAAEERELHRLWSLVEAGHRPE